MNKNLEHFGKERNTNIEIFRVFLMFIILFHHFFSHGLIIGKIGSEELPLSFENNVSASIHLLTHFGVVGFMFISSYYGISLRISKVCKLWFQLLFYSFFIVLGYSFYTQSYSFFQFFQSFFPLRIWWFCKYYFLIMLLSPIINDGISNISKNRFSIIIICIGIILLFSRFILRESSFNLDLLLYVYILGRYLRKYPINWIENYCISIFLVTSIVLFCLPLLFLRFQKVIYLSFLWSNNNILVFIQAISCFYIFLHHKPFFKRRITIASNVLAVYLITDHPIVRGILWSNVYGVTFFYQKTNSLFIVILLLVTIFCICLVIDKVREIIISPFSKYLVKLDELF